MTEIDQTVPEQLKPDISPPTGTNTAQICNNCRFRTDDGGGECKNPAFIDPETNRLRQVQNETIACEHYVAAGEFGGFDFDADIPLIIPGSFHHDYKINAICAIVMVKDPNDPAGGKIQAFQPLAFPIFRIIEILENPDTKEVFMKIRIGAKEIVLPASDISNKKGIIALTGYGLNTTENHAKLLCEYIMGIRSLNHIPESFVYDRFGWKPDGSFVLGTKKYTTDRGMMKIDLSPMSKSKETAAVHEKGTMMGWVKAVNPMLKYLPQRFKTYCAVVPPILKIIEEANFSLADIGDTSVGKTITCNNAMSIYGRPKDLELSANTTLVAIERVGMVFSDLPIHPDEIQNIKQDVLEAIVYMIGNGKGRMRGAKAGGTQELVTLRTVALFTSEKNVLTESSFGGQAMRVIETKNGLGAKNLDSATAIACFVTGVKENYGVFAPVLIQYIITHQAEIKQMYQESKKATDRIKGKYAFQEDMVGIAERMSAVFASILTAGKIFEKLYSEAGGDNKDPEEIVMSIFEKNVAAKESESYMLKGLRHITSWIAANRIYFLDKGNRETDSEGRKKMYAVKGNVTPDAYEILPSELKYELKKADFSYERLLDDFMERGLLITDKCKGKRPRQKTVWMEGEGVRVISLKREMIKTLLPDSDSEEKKR